MIDCWPDVNTQLRLESVLLAATTKAAVAFPRLEIEAGVTHGAALVMVQEQSVGKVRTATFSGDPAAPMNVWSGKNAYVHGVPLCVTVVVAPDRLTVPLLLKEEGFTDAFSRTTPGPDPERTEGVSHGSAVSVQGHSG